MARRGRGPRGCDGVDGTVLETGLAGVGRRFRTALGAGAVEQSAQGTEAGFRGCQAASAASYRWRVDPEFRSGPATAVVANHDAYQTAVDARPGKVAEP